MTILSSVKSLIYQKIPKSVLIPSLAIYSKVKTHQVRKIFEKADSSPAWLKFQQLEELQNRYFYKTATNYDSETVIKRGQEKAERILDLVGKTSKSLTKCLELGTGRGEVSEYLQQQGKQVTAIDLDLSHQLNLSKKSEVNYYEMDAAQLKFDSESFDLIFSFNSFEHFLQPDLVFKEAIKVLKKGGYLYLSFDPLYYSPWGLHAYHVITFPYCQCLFSPEMLDEFIEQKSLRPLKESLNYWSIERYRELWQQFKLTVKPMFYYEKYNPFYVNLIAEHPSCFKSKNKTFENFIISGIEVLFKKSS